LPVIKFLKACVRI